MLSYSTSDNSPDISSHTPKQNAKGPEQKMKLRDKRLLKLNLNRKKISDNHLSSNQEISPLSNKSNRKTPKKKVKNQFAKL